MTTSPFFSICIPTYNRAACLPRALDSALAQTFDDYEIVVVDNASSDSTQQVLERYKDPRIRVIRNDVTISLVANHNKGIQQAAGDWIVFLHSDDKLTIDALARLFDLCRMDMPPDAIVQTCDGKYKSFWDSLGDVNIYSASGLNAALLLFRYWGFDTAGACFRRDVINEYGGYNEALELTDWDLYFRLLIGGAKIVLMKDKTWCDVSLHDVSATTTVRETNRLIRSKEWLFNGGEVIAKYVRNEELRSLLLENIRYWNAAEVARLLMLVAAGNEDGCLKQIEALGYSSVRDAKKQGVYKHVMMYRLMGHVGHRFALKTIGNANNIAYSLLRKWRRVNSPTIGKVTE